jgi:hypothetical protein
MSDEPDDTCPCSGVAQFGNNDCTPPPPPPQGHVGREGSAGGFLRGAEVSIAIAHGAPYTPDMKPHEWAALWECALLDPIPIRGLATAATWRGTVSGTTRAPGKNHPLAGAWLVERYCPEGGICADPMFGTGGLWVKAPIERFSALHGCEIESHLHELGRRNLTHLEIDATGILNADAREWAPAEPADLVLFSPPFLQNHSAGATAHQREICERKALHTVQEFGAHPDNLGRKKPHEFWESMSLVYGAVSGYVREGGHVVVILRNRIRDGREIDEVGRHIKLIQASGLDLLGVHSRDLERPTGYQAWKVARNPSIPWVRYEWAVVARASSVRGRECTAQTCPQGDNDGPHP